MPLSGTLDELDVGGVIQMMAAAGQQGTLIIEGLDFTRVVCLAPDEITLFVPTAEEGGRFRLGSLLVARGLVSQSDLQDALKAGRQSGRRLGEVLVERNLVSADEIAQTVDQRFEEEFFVLFLVTEGSWVFHLDVGPERLLPGTLIWSRLAMNGQDLMQRALARAEEWRLMRERLTSRYVVLRFVTNPQVALDQVDLSTPIRSEVLRVDGRRSLRMLLQAAKVRRLELCRHLSHLVELGTLRPLTAKQALKRGSEAEMRGDWAEAADLYRYGAELEPRELAFQEGLIRTLRAQHRLEEAHEILLELGNEHLEAGDLTGAARRAEQVLARHPRSVPALRLLFRAQYQAGHPTAAREAGRRFLDAVRWGDLQETAQVARSLRELDPSTVDPEFSLVEAEGYLAEERIQEAIPRFRQAAEEARQQQDPLIEEVALRRLVQLESEADGASSQRLEALRPTERSPDRRPLVVLAVLILVGLALAVHYEVKARQYLRQARTLATPERSFDERSEALGLYRVVADGYSWSTVSEAAREEGTELEGDLQGR